MVAKITFPNSVKSALQYNERKVQRGVAKCIGAENVLWQVSQINFSQKLAVFERRHLLNDRATTKAIHISLNFSPGEPWSEQRMMDIATSYMDKIGFGEQPYFVYQHFDAGHPHLHIVSTTIQQDGSRINTHNIGRNQSQKARNEIEQAFGLIRAEQQKYAPAVEPVELTKVIYGKVETKRSISDVLHHVINSYNYTSLAELNAILQQYHVIADRGKENGRIYRNGGLVYRVLDEVGNKVGVPIKSSCLIGKPTVTHLKQRFEANKINRALPKQLLQQKLEGALQHRPASMQELIPLLAKQAVYTVLRQNSEGQLYDITFVDHQHKAVFNSSELGMQFNISALQSHFAKAPMRPAEQSSVKKSNTGVNPFKDLLYHVMDTNKSCHYDFLLQQIMTPAPTYENVPVSLLKKNRKRKRKRNQ